MQHTTHRTVSRGDDNRPITVDVREACRLSGLGQTSIRELLADGRIEGRWFGSKKLIVYASLEAYLLGLPEDRAA